MKKQQNDTSIPPIFLGRPLTADERALFAELEELRKTYLHALIRARTEELAGLRRRASRQARERAHQAFKTKAAELQAVFAAAQSERLDRAFGVSSRKRDAA